MLDQGNESTTHVRAVTDSGWHEMESTLDAKKGVVYVEGYLSDRMSKEGPPQYGYPINHLPESTVRSMTLETSFLEARKHSRA